MATSNSVSKLSSKTYLAKDFTSFRGELVTYAKNYFANQIQDFSEAGIGGMFVELAAFVGDSMSFYLDHQFNELNPATSVEIRNIESHARNAGVKITGAAPAVAKVTFYIEVPATTLSDGTYFPDTSTFPIIKAGTELRSNSGGIYFTSTDDVDFAEESTDGVLLSSYSISNTDSSGNPTHYIVTKDQDCISGQIKKDEFKIGTVLKPFRKITLTRTDVTQIINVKDLSGNEYHEVESLTQDTVFKRVQVLDNERDDVSDNLEVIPAPYRYITRTDFTTRLTKLQFGSGDASTTDDDIIPDPSDLALPLYGKKVFSKFSLDPNSLLKTHTLGISPVNTTISVEYRHGGGLSHNVPSEGIRNISQLKIMFPKQPTSDIQDAVIKSLDVKNQNPASGGSATLSLEELRSLISSSRNQQNRIVTQQDLLARLYTLPAVFGRVYRAGLRKNEENPLSTELYLLCRDKDGKLQIAPDALKKNLRVYLNEFRLISDAIDILDGSVINYKINFSIICTPSSNKSTVLANVITRIKKVSDLKFFQIDQPVVEADVINAIINTPGVLSMTSLEFNNAFGTVGSYTYSDIEFDMTANLYKGLIIGTPGSIFELKYPDSDITGTAE
jgi:hypothetical protein